MTKYTASNIFALGFIWTISIIFPLILGGYIPLLDLKEKIFPSADTRIKFSDISYGNDSTHIPVIVFSGPGMIVDDLDLKLKFRITDYSLYANIFQTAPFNEGTRLEVYSTPQGDIRLSLIYSFNNETKVFLLPDSLKINKDYAFQLKSHGANKLYVYWEDKLTGIINFDNILFSNFILGNAMGYTRPFQGPIYLDHCFVSEVSLGKWFLRFLKSRSAYLVFGPFILLIIILYSIRIFYYVYYASMESNEKEHLRQSHADTERKSVL